MTCYPFYFLYNEYRILSHHDDSLVAGGIVPLGLEKSCETNDIPIKELLAVMLNDDECQYGLELVTNVHNIPKGSRLAVSTNLLGSIIAVCMRATGQTESLTGPLEEGERRLVAARAILGEWLGGSGGGWQDSGGVWPGLKLIHGVSSQMGDPEHGISRGRLLPGKILSFYCNSFAADRFVKFFTFPQHTIYCPKTRLQKNYCTH
jgi:hypothetical protein